MTTVHIDFLVEEPSMMALLNAVLPKMIPATCTTKIFAFRGKHKLLKNLGKTLGGYTSWLPKNYRVVVIVDQNGNNCKQLKEQLEGICQNVGLQTRKVASSSNWQVVTRIAIEELEAWYFGDWQAVLAAYPRVSPNIPQQDGYRNPDEIKGGTWEAFERVLKNYRYHPQGLDKLQAARDIGPLMDPTGNQSRSFQVFREAILEAVA